LKRKQIKQLFLRQRKYQREGLSSSESQKSNRKDGSIACEIPYENKQEIVKLEVPVEKATVEPKIYLDQPTDQDELKGSFPTESPAIGEAVSAVSLTRGLLV